MTGVAESWDDKLHEPYAERKARLAHDRAIVRPLKAEIQRLERLLRESRRPVVVPRPPVPPETFDGGVVRDAGLACNLMYIMGKGWDRATLLRALILEAERRLAEMGQPRP